jgi:hypothetical protein
MNAAVSVQRRLAARRSAVVKVTVSQKLVRRLARSGRVAEVRLTLVAVSDKGGRLKRSDLKVRIRR